MFMFLIYSSIVLCEEGKAAIKLAYL